MLLVPVWKSQALYPVLLLLFFDHPGAIPPLASNVPQIHQIPAPIMGQYIQLATLAISGDPTKQVNYQRTQQSCYSLLAFQVTIFLQLSFRGGRESTWRVSQVVAWLSIKTLTLFVLRHPCR